MSLRRTKHTSKTIDRVAYKFRLGALSPAQEEYFAKTFGAVRWLYNRMLADKINAWQNFRENLQLTPAWYKGLSCCPWLKEVDSLALANAQINLDQSFHRFFNHESGHPKFKKKADHHDSYTTNHASVHWENGKLYLSLPKMEEEVRVINHRSIKRGGVLKSATISRDPSGKYYVSLLYEYAKEPVVHDIDPDNAIGLDMSMHGLYVDSEQRHIDEPEWYRKAEARLAREQRKLSHMKKGSSNYQKQRRKVAKLYSKTKNQRTDFLHKLSNDLTNVYDIIGIEDLNMRAMAQSLNYGKSVGDKGWGAFTAMLAYKAERKGKKLIRVDKWFPSSQMCHECGSLYKKTRDLSIRDWTCPVCGHRHDRDENAALNIKTEAVRMYCTC